MANGAVVKKQVETSSCAGCVFQFAADYQRCLERECVTFTGGYAPLYYIYVKPESKENS